MKKIILLFAAAFLMASCGGNADKSANDNQDSISVSTVDIQMDSSVSDDSIPVTNSITTPSDIAINSASQMAEKKESNQKTGSEYGDLVDQFVKNVKNSTYNYKHENWNKAEKLERKAWDQANKINKVKGKLTPDELKKFNKAYKELNRNADLWQ